MEVNAKWILQIPCNERPTKSNYTTYDTEHHQILGLYTTDSTITKLEHLLDLYETFHFQASRNVFSDKMYWLTLSLPGHNHVDF